MTSKFYCCQKLLHSHKSCSASNTKDWVHTTSGETQQWQVQNLLCRALQDAAILSAEQCGNPEREAHRVPPHFDGEMMEERLILALQPTALPALPALPALQPSPVCRCCSDATSPAKIHFPPRSRHWICSCRAPWELWSSMIWGWATFLCSAPCVSLVGLTLGFLHGAAKPHNGFVVVT